MKKRMRMRIMYTFKSLIYNMLEIYINNSEKNEGIISYYRAFLVCVVIKDIQSGENNSKLVESRNKLIMKYLNKPTTSIKTKLFKLINQDRKIIEEVLYLIKDYEAKDHIYSDQIDITKVIGCFGTVVQ